MTTPDQPPAQPSDALRAAMDQVRGVKAPPSATVPAIDRPEEEHSASARRRFWDLRGRVADDLARVQTPNAAVWPRPAAGLIAGLWAALMSWLVFAGLVLAGWVFAPLGSGSFADVMRASGAIWLLADGGVLQWQGATISLVPLLATLVIALFQRRAGRWLVTAVDAQDARAAASPLGYAVAAAVSAQALAAASIANATLHVPLWRSLLGSAIVAVLGFGWGVVRTLRLRAPERLRPALRVIARFGLAMACLATAAVLLSAVVHHAAFLDVMRAIAGDSTSTLQVILLCAAYLPTILGWALALLLGPGFSLGTGTVVTLGGVQVSALPPIPLFALVPDGMPTAAWTALLLCFAVAVWATWGALSDRAIETVVASLLLASAGAALVANAVFGGIGPGRLVAVGPTWWGVTLAVIAWLGLGFLAHAVWARFRAARQQPEESVEDAVGKLQP